MEMTQVKWKYLKMVIEYCTRVNVLNYIPPLLVYNLDYILLSYLVLGVDHDTIKIAPL